VTAEAIDPNLTALLKIHDPFWYRIRKTLTLPVAIGFLGTATVGSGGAIMEFVLLRQEVARVTAILATDNERAIADAALHQHVEDLDDRVTKMEALRDYQQGIVSEPRKKRR
jgi:hypothetical protein